MIPPSHVAWLERHRRSVLESYRRSRPDHLRTGGVLFAPAQDREPDPMPEPTWFPPDDNRAE